MNEARKRQAEEFARVVVKTEELRLGLDAMLEALELACFERWRHTEAGEGWRKAQGELAAIRQFGMMVRVLGGVRDE